MNRPFHDRGIIARYREYLPVTEATPVVSLDEGSTPLIYSSLWQLCLASG